MPPAHTRINLADVDDAAPANGFGARWEARVAREDLDAETGRVRLDNESFDVRALDAIRIAPKTARAFEAGPDGLEFIAFGPHHEADGELVDDGWAE